MENYCYQCMGKLNSDGVCKKCGEQDRKEPIPHHLAPSTILNHKYIVGDALGEGGFGITYIGRDTTLDIKVAIKEFYPNGYANRNNSVSPYITTTTEKQKEFFDRGKERFLMEARNIAKFKREKGIVDVQDYFEENDTAYIIMEYLDGITLSQLLRQNGVIDPVKIFTLMMPIMKSLSKVHAAGVIHRDISPDNIMYLKDGTLTLMDFGAARYFDNDNHTMSVMLKQGYAPAEQYRKNGEQGPWTDVYGLCATIYRCITGKVPEDSLDRMFEDTLKTPSQLGVNIPKELESVLMSGLAVYHQDRCQDMGTLINLAKDALREYKYENDAAQQPVVQEVSEPKNNETINLADDETTAMLTQSQPVYSEQPQEDDQPKVYPKSENPYHKCIDDKPEVLEQSEYQNSGKHEKPNKVKTLKFALVGVVSVVVLTVIVGACILFAGSDASSWLKTLGCDHQWKVATCNYPQTCKLCGKTEGEIGEHKWTDATCTRPKHCILCNTETGKTLEHTWKDATCTRPRYCAVCGTETGDTLEHDWSKATCSDPQICSSCGETQGETLPHDYKKATHSKPATCKLCSDEKCEEVYINEADSGAVDIGNWSVHPCMFKEKIKNCAELYFCYNAYIKNDSGEDKLIEGNFRVYVKQTNGKWVYIKDIKLEGLPNSDYVEEYTILFGYDTPMDILGVAVLPPKDFSGKYTSRLVFPSAIVVK